MGSVIRKVRIRIPSATPGGIADVVDAETGRDLGCRSLDLHADADGNVRLRLELIDAEADVVATWECTRVEERPL